MTELFVNLTGTDDHPVTVTTERPPGCSSQSITLQNPEGPLAAAILEKTEDLGFNVLEFVACAGFQHGAQRNEVQVVIENPENALDFGYRLVSLPGLTSNQSLERKGPIPWVYSGDTDYPIETPILLPRDTWNELQNSLHSGFCQKVFHVVARAGMNLYQ